LRAGTQRLCDRNRGRPAPDLTDDEWIEALRVRSDDALAALHGLLVRAARFEVGRRRAALPHLRGELLDDLAVQSADDALVAVLAKLDDFRGDSRFTTWAYKFALLEAAVRLRRLAWQGREVPLESESWERLAATGSSPERDVEVRELLDALRAAIDEQLSERQRHVLVSTTIAGVPIDVLAERLDTTRGALYKTLHDARQKLRRRLAEQGFDVGAWT
jgi:RNA polymerase sigma-70 factor (ECF subfamily)